MADSIGNSNKQLPEDSREKTTTVIKVLDVDKTYAELGEKGVAFFKDPIDMTGWGMRVAHFRDPENNLVEIWSELAKEKWDNDLKE